MPERQPTVGLAMIVRNEEQVLPRLADSLKGHIDHWTIVDTGSEDSTREVARQVFGFAPGEVIDAEWQGFGPSRNVALRAAEPRTDWVLNLDADHTFRGALDPRQLASDFSGIDIEERYANLRYWLPRLVRSGRSWHWVGRTHEFLAAPTAGNRARAVSCWVEHHGDGGNRETKFHRDLELLEQDWAERPGEARTAFYLGRTYDDLGEDVQAIAWYRRRADLGGWDEERFYASYRLGSCLLRAGALDEGCGALWRAWGERPWRAEPLVQLAEHYRLASAWPLAWKACEAAFDHCGALPEGNATRVDHDALFVDADAIKWRIAYEGSIAAWYVGARERGKALLDYLLALPDLPEAVRTAVAGNEHFYRSM